MVLHIPMDKKYEARAGHFLGEEDYVMCKRCLSFIPPLFSPNFKHKYQKFVSFAFLFHLFSSSSFEFSLITLRLESACVWRKISLAFLWFDDAET